MAGSTPVLTGSVTFDRDIVAVVATEAGIQATNPRLGSQVAGAFAADYVATTGIELDAGDSFTISPDRRTLTVTFDTESLTRMDIVDRLGQRVVVELLRVDALTPLAGSDFEFTPPTGDVDLFYYNE